MIYGYARISTAKQSIERQIRNIKEYDESAIIIQEVFTATKLQERAEFQKLLKILKPNDTIIFDSVSRMSRDATEGFQLYKELFEKNINLVFLKEQHINTEVFKSAIDKKLCDVKATENNELIKLTIQYINDLSLIIAEQNIIEAFKQAEKEVQDLRKRTIEGLVTARMNGRVGGRKKGETVVTEKSIRVKKLIEKYNNTFNGSLNDCDTIAIIKAQEGTVARNSYYKYKKELKQERGIN